MDLTKAGFDWDQGNTQKCQRHGVQIADVEEMFGRTLWVTPDPAHSALEVRYRAIGTNAKERHIFVVFAARTRGEETLIRPISARFMHRKEVRHHEAQKAKAQETAGPENR
jgi:uncharacterized DUF497 family protein